MKYSVDLCSTKFRKYKIGWIFYTIMQDYKIDNKFIYIYRSLLLIKELESWQIFQMEILQSYSTEKEFYINYFQRFSSGYNSK